MFEKGLAHTIVSCPDIAQEVRWKMIASLLPNRSPEEIGRRYDKLISDVKSIESGQNVTVTYVHYLNSSHSNTKTHSLSLTHRYKISTKDTEPIVKKDDEGWIKNKLQKAQQKHSKGK